MKKQFQHLQALLGAARVLSRGRGPLRASPALIAGVFALAVLLVARAQDAATSPPGPIEGATNAVAPAASTPSLPDPPSPSPSPAQNTPALPEPTPPPLGDIVQPPPAPSPSANETILEAQPVVPASSGPTAGADASPASPFAAPVSVQPTPALRATDVDFPSPSARNETEPLVAIGRPAANPDYGDTGNVRAAQLRTMPPERFTFDRAPLRDVLRFLAEAAGIPYIGIPEHAPQAQQLVTFRMTASPFVALQSVARQNGIRLTYDDGVWFMQFRDDDVETVREAEERNELIGVIYQLRNDPVDRIRFKGEAAGLQAGGTTASGGTASTPSLPLQNSQSVFQANNPKIVNEIRVMLGMQPLLYGVDGQVIDPEIAAGESKDRGNEAETVAESNSAASAAAGTATFGPGRVSGRYAGSAEGQSQITYGGNLNQFFGKIYVPPQKPQVVYNSDMNILWIVATRQQHKWVAGYLQRVDKPQDLIAIEVKFFETRKNPQTDFGINWEGTFGGDGFVVTGSATANPSGLLTTRDSSETTTTSDRQTRFGSVTVDNTGRASTEIDSRALTTSTPFSAVLSTSQASVALQAFVKDRDSSLVQYPRVLTINNREVAITSAENTPVNAGVSTVQSGGTSSQPVGTLEYIPVGTQINILPKAVGKDQIALTVAITISQIVDFIPLNLGTGSNEYPVTTQRVYNASLQVDSGYTLAVGGLEKVADRNVTGGIPVLKDIPGLGYLFKNKSRNRDRSNLIIFITPYLISDPSRTPGISESPEAVIPLRPGVPPPAPNFTPEGSLLGGDAAIPAALRWLEFQLNYFTQINAESNDDPARISQLRNVIQRARSVANHLQTRVQEAGEAASPQQIEESQRADSLLLELNKVLAAAQLDQFQLQEGFP